MEKIKRVYKKRKNRVDKRNRSTVDHRFPFKEQAFKMWMEGMTVSQITSSFIGTENQISLHSMGEIKRQEKWVERRIKIENEIKRKTNLELERVNGKKIHVLNQLVDKVMDVVSNDIKKFERFKDDLDSVLKKSAEEKTPLPVWYVTTIKEVSQIIRTHNEMIADINKSKTPDSQNNNPVLNQFNFINGEVLPQDVQSKLLDVISAEKTKMLTQNREDSKREYIEEDDE